MQDRGPGWPAFWVWLILVGVGWLSMLIMRAGRVTDSEALAGLLLTAAVLYLVDRIVQRF